METPKGNYKKAETPKEVEKPKKAKETKPTAKAKKSKKITKGTVNEVKRNMEGGKTLIFKEDVPNINVSISFVEENKIKKGYKVDLPK